MDAAIALVALMLAAYAFGWWWRGRFHRHVVRSLTPLALAHLARRRLDDHVLRCDKSLGGRSTSAASTSRPIRCPDPFVCFVGSELYEAYLERVDAAKTTLATMRDDKVVAA